MQIAAVRDHRGTRMGSCAHRGLRKNAQVRNYYDCKFYEYDEKYGKHASWKASRKKQYKDS